MYSIEAPLIHPKQTQTPAILYTIDMFYAAANISQFVNINWFLGEILTYSLSATNVFH